MTNFIFKSPWTFKKIINQLEIVLNEQRHQRQDLAAILYLIKKLQTDKVLEKQTLDYYSKLPPQNWPDNGSTEDSD